MKFRTEIEVNKGRVLLEHTHVLLTIGSCFAENIAHKLETARFKVQSNPFGVLYNPASIRTALQLISGRRTIENDDLVFHDGLWHSLLHHSTFSDMRKEILLERIARVIQESQAFLQEARHVILTLGTAFVYRYRQSGKIAANCHKIPAERFERFLLSPEEVADTLCESFRLLKKLNSRLHFIVTVSPVRHLKDGLVQNQLSKATLLCGLHKALKNESQAEYFPSYEIMMDDLRDYRFYEANLTHPNALAQSYIWEKFMDTFFSKACRQTALEMEKLHKALKHRPLHPQSPANRRFFRQQLRKIDILEQKYPYLDFSEEKKYFR